MANHLTTAVLALFLFAAGPALAQDATPATGTDPAASGRMEFDERLIKGETAAGSVYLFQRRPRDLPALVPLRVSYRPRIVDPILGDRPTPPAPAGNPPPPAASEPPSTKKPR